MKGVSDEREAVQKPITISDSYTAKWGNFGGIKAWPEYIFIGNCFKHFWTTQSLEAEAV